jgi:WD40 repeat protein
MVKLFNLPILREIAGLRGHLTWVGDLAFSPDGQQLISTGGDGSRIWRTFGRATEPSLSDSGETSSSMVPFPLPASSPATQTTR